MLESLDGKIKGERRNDTCKEKSVTLRKHLPLKTVDELTEFNEMEYDDMKCFDAFVKSVEGKDLRNNIYRIFGQVFADTLAVSCSWYGKRGNYPVRDLMIMKTILESMVAAHHTTVNEIEKYAVEWFRLSRQRLKA